VVGERHAGGVLVVLKTTILRLLSLLVVDYGKVIGICVLYARRRKKKVLFRS